MAAALLAAMILAGGSAPSAVQAHETLAEVTVHGNVLTTDAEVRRLAGLDIGMAVTPQTVDEAAARLRAAKKFDRVEVLKRFASISDPSQIVIVIVVDEGPVHVELTKDGDHPTRVVKNRGPGLMFLPILDSEDAYGFSYGVRFALPNPLGKQSRVSFPLTWGGERQAAVELDKQLDTTRLVRFTGGAGVSQRTNPFYEAHDTRERVWARAEREVVKNFRVGATSSWQHVSFAAPGTAGTDRIPGTSTSTVGTPGTSTPGTPGTPGTLGTFGTFGTLSGDVIVDTRLDPMLARNAVYGRASIEHVRFGDGQPVNRIELDGRGYLGLFGQNVLVARAYKADADAPLPPYLESLFGGIGTVRGFRAGSAVGDTLVAGSLEVLVPLTSPLDIARLGVSAFIDAGAAYDKGARFGDQPLERGVGGSVWVTATFVRFSVAVAHGLGGSTRVHVGGTVSF